MKADCRNSDGKPINDVKEQEVLDQAEIIRSKGLKNIVIAGVCMWCLLTIPVLGLISSLSFSSRC